jgi:hypothetical protein
MKLTQKEIEYLSAWAREEWEPWCYLLHAHNLQRDHGVESPALQSMIKAWSQDASLSHVAILGAAHNPKPDWPWSSEEEWETRYTQARKEVGLISQSPQPSQPPPEGTQPSEPNKTAAKESTGPERA